MGELSRGKTLARPKPKGANEMSKKGSGLRRAAAVVAASVAMMAIAGSGASAASTGLPVTVDAAAASQALRLKITLPSLAELEAILTKVTGQTVTLPDVDLPASIPTVIDQKISLNNATVLKSLKGSNKAAGFAAATVGNLLPNANVATHCVKGGSCTDNTQSLIAQTLSLPAGLGKVDVAAAKSSALSPTSSLNTTALAQVDLSLAELIKTAGLSETLKTLTDIVNAQVLPVVNQQLAAAEKTINDLLAAQAPAIKKEIDKVITLGTIKDLPQLDKVGLLNLTVLAANANTSPKTVGGVNGMLASARSKVTDLDILGGWATIDAVGLKSESYANGVKAQAKAQSDAEIVGLDLGGALGIHVEEQDIKDFLGDPSTLIEAIAEDAPDGLEEPFGEIVAALKLLQTIAGISFDFIEESTMIDPKGQFAKSSAGTMVLRIEPKIPTLDALKNATPGVGGVVPRLKESDYVSAGIRIQLELPSAATSVAVNNPVKGQLFRGPDAKSGVGTPLLAVVMLLGAAFTIRRFALSK